MATVQESLFPFSSPVTVLAHLERIQRRVTRLAPDLGSLECVRLLSELALIESVMDTQERYCRHMAEIKARRLGVLA
jgi:hypothetical protein